MLALSRKKGASIMIGEDIEIIILGVNGDQVKLGIHAPKDISVHRQEVYEQIKSQNRIAAQNSIENINAVKDLMKK